MSGGRGPARGRAGGKVILFGEHVVVYGRPAVAAGLPLGLTVEVEQGDGPRLLSDVAAADDVRGARLVAEAAAVVGLDAARVVARVVSELPPGRGLGSSAALSVATLRACAAAAGVALDRDAELREGRRLEAIFHGTPSGIDPAAAALGATCFRFVRGEPPTVVPLAMARALPLVVAFGATPRSTGAAVGGLRARWETERDLHERLFDEVAAVVERGARALQAGDLAAVGACFDANQALLVRLGVSSPEVDGLVAAARAAGAHGAKLTGGGAGGAVLAVGEDPQAVAAALRRGGAEARVVRVGEGTAA